MIYCKANKYKGLQTLQPPFCLLGRILHNRESTSTFSRSNREITTTELWFDVCLLNENHHEKLIIKRLKSTEEAVKEVKVLSEAMGFSVVKYNPEVSEATRLRRAKEGKRR